MRYDRRYTRTLNMITAPEIPRLPNGGVALCHVCQRVVFFAGGFMELLILAVEREARNCRHAYYSPRSA